MSDPNGMCRRAVAMFAMFIVAMFIAVAMSGCDRGGAAKALEAQMHRPPAPVQTVDAIAKDVPSYIDEIGRAVATEVVTVRPQVSGKTTEIHFADGADLKKGDLLFTIDPRPFQAALDQAKAAVAQGQANLKLSESDLKRMQSLSDTGAVCAGHRNQAERGRGRRGADQSERSGGGDGEAEPGVLHDQVADRRAGGIAAGGYRECRRDRRRRWRHGAVEHSAGCADLH